MFRLAVHLLTLIAAIGCDKPDAPAPAPAPATAAATAPSSSGASASMPVSFGTIRGKVTLTGWTAPPPAAQMVTCGDHKIPIANQSVILRNSGLENVIIFLKNPPPFPATLRSAPAILDQIQCVYVPHVVALRTGQTLTVKSGEAILHNVHMLPEVNPGANFGMNQPMSRDMQFIKPEIFPVKCDVHPWMQAWVAVFDHPWFAVSANGGKFQIDGVPAGPQTFVAWHERFGEIEQTVTVTTDQAREITFNFEPPKEK